MLLRGCDLDLLSFSAVGTEEFMDHFVRKHATVGPGDAGQKSQPRFPQLCAVGWLGSKRKRPEADQRHTGSHDQRPSPWGPRSQIAENHRADHHEKRGRQQVFQSDFQQTRAQPEQDGEGIEGKIAHGQYL